MWWLGSKQPKAQAPVREVTEAIAFWLKSLLKTKRAQWAAKQRNAHNGWSHSTGIVLVKDHPERFHLYMIQSNLRINSSTERTAVRVQTTRPCHPAPSAHAHPCKKKNLILWFSRHFNTRSVCIDFVRKFTTQDTTSSVASYGMLPTSSWSLLLRWYRCLQNSCMKALPKLRLDQKLWLSCQVWLFRQLPWQSRNWCLGCDTK